MSPEYALDGHFSVKSDVFSFGVVVLEIISGKRNTGFYQVENELSLLGYVSVSSSTKMSSNILREMFDHYVIYRYVTVEFGVIFNHFENNYHHMKNEPHIS